LRCRRRFAAQAAQLGKACRRRARHAGAEILKFRVLQPTARGRRRIEATAQLQQRRLIQQGLRTLRRAGIASIDEGIQGLKSGIELMLALQDGGPQ
jgi:hypothetical protein